MSRAIRIPTHTHTHTCVHAFFHTARGDKGFLRVAADKENGLDECARARSRIARRRKFHPLLRAIFAIAIARAEKETRNFVAPFIFNARACEREVTHPTIARARARTHTVHSIDVTTRDSHRTRGTREA